MSLHNKRMTAWVLILAMVITLLPMPVQVEAAGGHYFTFENFSTDESAPTQSADKIIELRGMFNGVQPNSITYKLERIVNGQVVSTRSGEGAVPIIVGNTFRFMNIQLEQGLNRITVSGMIQNGNIVSESCYIYFPNVPAIHDVKLPNGTELHDGKPVVVNNQTLTLIATAPNATSVTFGDVVGVTGDGKTFIGAGIELQPGFNEISIIARNETQTYADKRQVVYFNGNPTAYNVQVNDSPKVSLDGYPTINETQTQGTVEGVLLLEYDPAVGSAAPTVSVELKKDNSVLHTFTVNAASVTREVYDGTHIGFRFVTTDTLDSATNFVNGEYSLEISANYGGQTAAAIVPFRFRNQDSPYITEILQIYNPTISGTNNIVSYTSSGNFTSGTIIELPIWVLVKSNKSPNDKWSVAVSQNGNPVNPPTFNVESNYKTQDGYQVFKITHLPRGMQTLTFTVTDTGDNNPDFRSFNINYVPTPSIQIENLYDGQIFEDNIASSANAKHFSEIKGRLVNFNLNNSAELDSLTVTLNGISKKVDSADIDTATGEFALSAVQKYDMKLVPGVNRITISGISGGVRVESTVTVYLVSSQVADVLSIVPVPHDDLNPRLDDPDQKFRLIRDGQYVTHEKLVDVLFEVANAETVVVQVDGIQLFTVSIDIANDSVSITKSNTTQANLTRISASGKFDFRLGNLPLPKSGTTSVVITATLGSGSTSKTLMITRELSPYIILSPKLPEESVVNQNFVQVSILAEGADQVLIGKEAMVKDQKEDIFRLEVRDLKAGKNTIKFTVVRGEEKLNDQFTINYANQNIVGAQYKAEIPKSGKISVFNKELTIELPKGTMLRKPLDEPGSGMPSFNIDLFDSQQLLFGIADKEDGRTVKRYNRVGEVDGSGKARDGELANILPNVVATTWLNRPAHFGYASNLYWIDAGYFDNTSVNEYRTVHGLHPYAPGNEFFTRTSTGLNSRMLEPTQRGTITIKYDSSISNEGAKTLGIWKLVNNPGSPQKWVPMGGKVNTKNKTVTAPFDGFGYYAVFQLRYSYNDIVGHPFARDDINLIFSRGIMTAKNNAEFGVYDNITRGEFATMMVKILDLPLNYEKNRSTFLDVPTEIIDGMLWDYRYIETAVRAGIITGRSPQVFDPMGALKREDAAVMIARAMNLKLGTYEKDLPRLQKMFTDANDIDYYAVPAVTAVARAGIIQGMPNTMTNGDKQTYRFDPESNLNRAQAAVIAVRVLDELGKL